jgi:hypothetical protein
MFYGNARIAVLTLDGTVFIDAGERIVSIKTGPSLDLAATVSE